MGKKSKFAFDPKVFLATVNGGRTASDYPKDAVIFLQGAPADAVFYIQKGKVKVAVTSEQGKEAVVAILDAGSFFGEGCLIGQPLRLARATAMIDSCVILHPGASHCGIYSALITSSLVVSRASRAERRSTRNVSPQTGTSAVLGVT